MIKLNEVTWYSKLAAILFFLGVFPLLTFYIGVQYQKAQESISLSISEPIAVPVVKVKKDAQKNVMDSAKEVLVAFKNKDYQKLENLTSSDGLSWNEVPNLDLTKNDILTSEISNIPNNPQKYLFGYTDGKGDPIYLTISEYLSIWIYNHDYASAPEVGVNKILDGGSNSVNTILQDSGNRTVVAYHFKGFDPKFGGMDWTTLYLVFDLQNGEYKLRGIAKNNWTI
ncbi:MAG: hypothetical protein ABI430_00775 [Candidatus Taylorbacteria bacterium]